MYLMKYQSSGTTNNFPLSASID